MKIRKFVIELEIFIKPLYEFVIKRKSEYLILTEVLIKYVL